MAVYYLKAPLNEQDVTQLRIGDMVYVSGNAFTCRSRLHRYVFDEGHSLPEGIRGRNLLIHTGPIIIRKNNAWRLVSFMPTSSIRFEKWGARSVEQWGLRMIIGKTTMGKETMKAMQKHGCVHLSPQSVSPNLWVDSIQVEGCELFDELGSIEATWYLKLNHLGPFVVDIDCYGNNLYGLLDESIASNRIKVLEKLGIPADYHYTELYKKEIK